MMPSAPLLDALILGIVEGLTEFIPVSSTGHLILLVEIGKLASPPGFVMEVVIQLGAILAICFHYRIKLFQLAGGYFVERAQRRFAHTILLAFLPAAVIGALFHDTIKTVLFSAHVVSISLIVGGIVILIVERLNLTFRFHSIESISPLRGLLIGFLQCLAMIPGVSRSGATIIGAMLMGVERKAAMEFSFFLAMPTMLGAASYDLYKNWAQLNTDDITLIAIGFIAAFCSAYLVVRYVLQFVSRHGFTLFGWYRIALGSAMLLLLAA